MDEDYTRKILTSIIFIGLLVLSFFLMKPLIMSMIVGILFAFIFGPIYAFFFKHTKKKNLSAIIVSIILIAVVVVPLWYVIPIAIDESIKVYMASQEWDFVTPLKTIFPKIFQSEQFSNEIGQALKSFVSKLANSLMNYLSNIILNFATLLLKLLVILFTFFFFLRDREKIEDYIKSLLPFSKDVEKKLFKSSSDLTASILYGQVLLGIIEGIIVGIGLWIFNVPGAFLLTAIAALLGIFPIIGTALVWIPVAIYLFMHGTPISALGIILFGLIASFIESFLKPIFISRRAKMNTSIVLFGMIGGLMLFGILGVVLGPLILAYLFIIIEVFRNKKLPEGVIIPPEKE
ncbi:MAG TPA: AI-2E family transporter [Candidatus Pacearchaeota archaeon]|jgi:predicted PurR-regulated permease PerM|nr:AI-2E family transporter [Candidatus Pacearchaeota archaeon]